MTVLCKVEFKLQDCWVGAYWQVEEFSCGSRFVDLWVCLLPMFPLHFEFSLKPRKS